MTQLLRNVPFRDVVENKWFKPAVGTCGFVQWRQMIEEFRAGKWLAWSFQNGPEGLVIGQPRDGRLFIFYLTGRGILKKRGEIARQLGDVSKSLGLNGMSGCCKDKRRAEFFRGAGCKIVNPRRRTGEDFFDMEWN